MADDVIRVEVLGTPRILKNGVEISFSRKRVRALLFYLATELKPVPRTTLAGFSGPTKPAGRKPQPQHSLFRI